MTSFLQSFCLFALIFLRSCAPCPAADHIEQSGVMVASFENKLVASIWIQEGGTKTRFPYGCEHMVNGRLEGWPKDESERVCRNTIEHSWSKFIQQSEQTDFIAWLGSTYARDPLWADKVKRLLK